MYRIISNAIQTKQFLSIANYEINKKLLETTAGNQFVDTLPGGARPFMLLSLMERLVVFSWLFLVRGSVLFTSVPVNNSKTIK